jgi:hypothetical protein
MKVIGATQKLVLVGSGRWTVGLLYFPVVRPFVNLHLNVNCLGPLVFLFG